MVTPNTLPDVADAADTAAPPVVPRWAEWMARAVPLAVLPSGLWRMAMAVGIPVGFTGQLAEDWRPGLETSTYITLLTLVSEGFALLALGLVRPWGERVPRWIPFLAGRRIPVWVAVVPATLGSLAATALAWPMFLLTTPAGAGGAEGPQGMAGFVMNACYFPLLLWGPLVAILTVAYVRRRRNGGGGGSDSFWFDHK
ncbi:hypothetical protein ABZ419_24685 [Streptomyces cinnamoneus]|uniref:hypothetical protein n=1 Tax=Streptomyces cinnamoneus TaxID=53446 RepID=UPI00340C9C58